MDPVKAIRKSDALGCDFRHFLILLIDNLKVDLIFGSGVHGHR
jgi:hypothetical protein